MGLIIKAIDVPPEYVVLAKILVVCLDEISSQITGCQVLFVAAAPLPVAPTSAAAVHSKSVSESGIQPASGAIIQRCGRRVDCARDGLVRSPDVLVHVGVVMLPVAAVVVLHGRVQAGGSLVITTNQGLITLLRCVATHSDVNSSAPLL